MRFARSYVTLIHITSPAAKLRVAWRDGPPSACRNLVVYIIWMYKNSTIVEKLILRHLWFQKVMWHRQRFITRSCPVSISAVPPAILTSCSISTSPRYITRSCPVSISAVPPATPTSCSCIQSSPTHIPSPHTHPTHKSKTVFRLASAFIIFHLNLFI